MNYGCIGERLGHSFSAQIHGMIAPYSYELRQVAREELDDFMTRRNFAGINVTIPYKEAVIPYLYEIEDMARSIGAVNTIVNRDDKLYGYNTDFYGMCALCRHAGVSLAGKKVAILGTGGTSKTAKAVAAALGAAQVLTVSREKKHGAIDYDELTREHGDTQIIINTTPVGMFPNGDGCPVNIDSFPRLSGVLDAVYNPLRTRLVMEAKAKGIPAEGGLYMLVAQGVKAAEIFTQKSYGASEIERVYRALQRERTSLVLVGMPGSGKSTVGALLAKALARPLLDTDAWITQAAGTDIPSIFQREGEVGFRAREGQAVQAVAMETGAVIATGGGTVISKENVNRLLQNGRIYFLDRPIEAIVPTDDRPLGNTKEAIQKRYEERLPLYLAAADVTVKVTGDAMGVAQAILEDFQS